MKFGYTSFLLLICCWFFPVENIHAQTLGGRATFSFLKLPLSPQLSSLGGINTAQQTNDVSLSFHNPALLSKEMHTQTMVSFNSFYGGIKNYAWMMAYHHASSQTDFSVGTHFIDYGTIPQTDASGAELGNLQPSDYVVQISAARGYLSKWRYGASFKFIGSNYGTVRASGIAVDVGVLYRDTAAGLQIALTAINMGTQLKTYGTEKEDLPFDLQVGISKKLADAPLQFSLQLHHLHQFDITYSDPLFNGETGDENTGKGELDKIFRHAVLGLQVFLGEKLELNMGYNHLRRKELNIANSTNGLNGFSMGIGVLLDKLQIRYARTWYQNNKAYQQFSLNLPLNRYFGLGKFGNTIEW